MYSLDTFKIDFKALKEGENTFEYSLNDAYFEAIEAPEVKQGEINVSLSITRTDDFFDLKFRAEGIVHVPCDLCLEDMEQLGFSRGEILSLLPQATRKEGDAHGDPGM